MRNLRERAAHMTLWQKVRQINWVLVLLLAITCCIGFATLYSAGNGNMNPWASKQIARFGVGMGLMLGVALVDVRVWWRYAYIIYGISFAMLVAVEAVGVTGMGAQRWINLGFIQLQPSEIMRIALVLALARYFHGSDLEDVGHPTHLIAPLLMVFLPVALVMRQPDLGTALLLVAGSAAMFLAAGVRLWKFAIVLAAGGSAVPVAWQFLHDYQRKRVLIFLNPENDPLGAGYHITQSKIALGSGGIFGKGFMLGTQSHLNFLPEKQTDFIFTMLAEEWGLIGGLVLLSLYVMIVIFGVAISLRSRNQFARLVALGVTVTFFLYMFINIAMVMGLVPVVGVPLPLISYGGTAMITLLFGFGLIIGVYVHRDIAIGRCGASEE